MRLPARTVKHQQSEDARLFHERLYEHYLIQKRVVIGVVGDDGVKKLQMKLSGNLKRFWNDRGFLFRTRKSSPQALEVWIEPMPPGLHLGRNAHVRRKATAA